MKTCDFTYGIRLKDLKQKYFGDILSPEVIAKQSKPKENTIDKEVKEILNEINNGTIRTN